jgi:hypothetical protein
MTENFLALSGQLFLEVQGKVGPSENAQIRCVATVVFNVRLLHAVAFLK